MWLGGRSLSPFFLLRPHFFSEGTSRFTPFFSKSWPQFWTTVWFYPGDSPQTVFTHNFLQGVPHKRTAPKKPVFLHGPDCKKVGYLGLRHKIYAMFLFALRRCNKSVLDHLLLFPPIRSREKKELGDREIVLRMKTKKKINPIMFFFVFLCRCRKYAPVHFTKMVLFVIGQLVLHLTHANHFFI